MSFIPPVLFRCLLTVLLVGGVLSVAADARPGKARKPETTRTALPAGAVDGFVPNAFLF